VVWHVLKRIATKRGSLPVAYCTRAPKGDHRQEGASQRHTEHKTSPGSPRDHYAKSYEPDGNGESKGRQGSCDGAPTDATCQKQKVATAPFTVPPPESPPSDHPQGSRGHLREIGGPIIEIARRAGP